MKNLTYVGLLLSSLLFSSMASSATWYRVEVMLIAYTNEQYLEAENWPISFDKRASINNDSELEPISEDDNDSLNAEGVSTIEENTVEDLKLAEEKNIQQQYQWWLQPEINKYSALLSNFQFQQIPKAHWAIPLQPLEHLMLADALKHIQPRSDMKVIWHQAWVEPIQEKSSSILHPLDISLEEEELQIHLTGNFSVSMSRYLHINTQLTMQHSLEGTPVRAAKILQSRRMRSGELHYLDHPMLGIMVQVMPINDSLL